MINANLPALTGDAELDKLKVSLSDVFRSVQTALDQAQRQTPQIAIVPMIAANGGGGAFAWRNPYPRQKLIITKILLDIRTGSVGGNIDIGTSPSASGTSDDLIDGLNVTTPGIFTNLTYAGVNGADARFLTADQYITGTITGDQSLLKANCYIEFYFADPVL